MSNDAVTRVVDRDVSTAYYKSSSGDKVDCSSKQSKRHDLHLKGLHRETNDNNLYYYIY